MSKYPVQEVEQFDPSQAQCYCIIETGKSCILRKQISDHLQKQRPHLKEVHNVDECNVILVLCPIVSRAGTDIDAALKKLNACSESKPAIFMVFHHTFDPDKIVPDSSEYINRRNTLTVDCLFSEDEGLLTCDMNNKALTKIVKCFEYQESCLDILQRCICCIYVYCCWILAITKGHLEMQQMYKWYKWYISLPCILLKYLVRLCHWKPAALLASMWNYFTRQETHESSTSNNRNRLKHTDDDKNV